MNIYTKTGDSGTTSLGNGKRVSKASPLVEAYGTIDELNSHLGLLRAHSISEHHQGILISIQEMLMRYAAAVSCCKGYDMNDSDIHFLEQEIDALQKSLSPQKFFILPGGNLAAAQCHVARCVCRRAERLMVQVKETSDTPDEKFIVVLNRLSDYLFVLARSICNESQVAELHWIAKV